ncbi:MAG: hypothetical protein V1746_03005 [bacterium]
MEEKSPPLLIVICDHDGVLLPLSETPGKSPVPLERATEFRRALQETFSENYDVQLMVSSLRNQTDEDLHNVLEGEGFLPLRKFSPIDGYVALHNLLRRRHSDFKTEGPSFGERLVRKSKDGSVQSIIRPLRQTFEGREMHVFFLNDELDTCLIVFQELFPLLEGQETKVEKLKQHCLPFQKDAPWSIQVESYMKFIAEHLSPNMPHEEDHGLSKTPQQVTPHPLKGTSKT